MASANLYSDSTCPHPRHWYFVAPPKVRHKPPYLEHVLRSLSPRWLVSNDQEDQALKVLADIRRAPQDSEVVQLEFLEIKAQHMFEVDRSRAKFPQYQSGTLKDNFLLGLHDYASLFTNKSLRKRVFVAVFTMVFQQCRYSHFSSTRLLLTYDRVWYQRHLVLRRLHFPILGSYWQHHIAPCQWSRWYPSYACHYSRCSLH